MEEHETPPRRAQINPRCGIAGGTVGLCIGSVHFSGRLRQHFTATERACSTARDDDQETIE